MALLMAVIGLYGVIAYAVTQRTQELGVRMALGAQPAEILWLVVGQGMKLAALVAAAGLVAAVAITRLLRNQLFHVSAFDPPTLALMAAALIGAATLASYIPARRPPAWIPWWRCGTSDSGKCLHRHPALSAGSCKSGQIRFFWTSRRAPRRSCSDFA